MLHSTRVPPGEALTRFGHYLPRTGANLLFPPDKISLRVLVLRWLNFVLQGVSR